MNSLSNPSDRKPRRHDLIFVTPEAWSSLLKYREDLAEEPLVVGWVDRGWPLVARRVMPDEADGLALGLPLPPSLGKRRLSILMQPDDMISTAPPPQLSAAIGVAPEPWRRTLERVVDLAAEHGVEARVFGSLAWRMLTGLDYLTAGSDLDLLMPLPRGRDIARLTADLSAIASEAPMRLDGEFIRDDGAGVNWREIHTGAREVLVKTAGGAALLDANHFLWVWASVMTTALAVPSHEPRSSVARLASVHEAEAIAAMAVRSLLEEVETWPKPGLVSHVDPGSHADMDAGTLRRSADAIQPYLHALAEAGAQRCAMGHLRIIGLEAEAAMLTASGGVNTHRGAIFGLGLLCAAAGARIAGRADSATPLGAVVARLWGRGILDGPVLLHSHGGEARRRYGAGGARLEAARGFPAVYEIGLPALQRGALMAPGDAEAARVQACFALIAALEDTNLLHRSGPSGLRFAQRAARGFLENGGVGQRDWRERACAVHRAFVARRLSPGGSADLLAMSLFVEACEA